MAARTKIFIAYCFPEKRWLDRVQAAIEPFAGERCVIWDERKLKAGTAWKTELPDVLATTKVAMMIVSDLFLDSDFITRAKLPSLLEKERESGLEICWVLAGHCLFELAGLKEADAGNNVGSAFDGLGLAQRDAAVAAIAKKVAGYLGVEPGAVELPAPPKKVLLPSAIPQVVEPKPVPKRRRNFGKKTDAEKAAEPSLIPATPEAPPAAPVPPPPPAPAPGPAVVEAPPPVAAPLPADIPPPPPAPAPKAEAPKVEPPETDPPKPADPVVPVPPKPEPAPKSAPEPKPAEPPPKPAEPEVPALKPVASESLAPVEAHSLEPAPAMSETRRLSLETMITTRQATVLKLSRMARWFVVLAILIALGSVAVLFTQSIEHFLIVGGFALVVASLALRLHVRSRYLGQGLVGMRYTASGLADEALPARQRDTLVKKADEYLAEN